MRELYLECYSGISGDMSVAALLDIGASEEHLRKTLKTMPLSGYSIEITRVKKSGIDACDFNVILDKDNHDHDMEYLHGHSHKDKGETVDNKTDTDNKHISEKCSDRYSRKMKSITIIIITMMNIVITIVTSTEVLQKLMI